MRVIGDRVLVALPPEVDEVTTASGLVLVRDPDKYQTPTRGIVVALGEKTGEINLDDARTAVRELLVNPCYDYYKGSLIGAAVDEVLAAMAPASFDVAVGDCVIFPRASGEEIEQDGIQYVILRESEIIGIVEPKASAE